MIDPHEITDFNRSDHALEEFALFAPAVAGKTAAFIAQALDRFLFPSDHPSPFAHVRALAELDTLTTTIRDARLGKWRTLTSCYHALAHADLDLRACTLDQLESIPGIGPKTSRFFLIHTRPGARVAVLDTHILAYLRSIGIDAPRYTPQTPKRYAQLEAAFLDHARDIGRADDLAAFDLEIWSNSTTRSSRSRA
jgi:hypothetical protein